MFIDKISLTFPIAAKSHQTFVVNQLINYPKELGCGWIAVRGGAYKCAARLHARLPAGDLQGHWSKDYVLLQADPRNGQGNFLRAEWNPARFDDSQRNYLFKKLNDILDVPPPMVGKALVTRADIAIDLDGVDIGDYAFERANAPYRTAITKKGALQTMYLGLPQSAQVCVYDKGEQLHQPDLMLTRIEMHCRPRLLASDLSNMRNPFKNFRIYDVKHADLQLGVAPQKTFARAAAAYGIQAVLDDYPDLAAKKLKAALVASPAAFWQPNELWKKWPEAIQNALPPFGNPDHYGTFDGPFSPTLVQSIAQATAFPEMCWQSDAGSSGPPNPTEPGFSSI